MPRSRSDHAFDALLLACVLVHAVRVLWQPWIYIADDALFYFQIAYNVGHGQGFTFSGLMPTNGFHPFWLLVCVPLGWLAASKHAMFTAVSVLIVLLNTATLIAARDLFGRARLPHPSAAVLFAAPYLFFVAIGMEGHLSALLLILTMRAACALARDLTATNLFRTALLGGLVVFSRLDLAILLAPLGVWSVVRFLGAGRDRSRLRELGLALVLAATPVLLFVLINCVAFGDPIPVSGLLKLERAGAEELATRFNGIVIVYLIVVLAGAAAAAALPPRSDFDRVHICLAIGVLAFLAYLVFMTSEAYSWYYYSWAVAAMSGAAILLQRLQQVASARASSPFLLRAPQLFAIALSVFGVASMVRYGDRIAQPPPFSHGETGLAARARQASIQRVFTFDRPGQLAFYEDLSVLAADGLTTNAAFQRELAVRGIHWALDELRIQAIVVPRLGGIYGHELCGRSYLASLRFVCDGDDGGQITRIEAVSRLNGASLGFVDLAGRPRLEFFPDMNLVVVLLDEER